MRRDGVAARAVAQADGEALQIRLSVCSDRAGVDESQVAGVLLDAASKPGPVARLGIAAFEAGGLNAVALGLAADILGGASLRCAQQAEVGAKPGVAE
jgi:hypothetical protein